MMKQISIVAVLLAVSFSAVTAETLRLPVTADNSVVMVDGEWELNAGSGGRMRIKGNQHIVAMRFDMTPVKGRTVTRAELVCAAAAESISGVTISTVAAPWDEMKSSGLTAGIDGLTGWGYPGARFPAVSGGNAYTFVHQADSKIIDGWYHWEVEPDVVHALAVGAAFGIAVHEHDADYGRNPTVYSREQSGRQPYLLVETEDASEPDPPPPSNLRLLPSGRRSARLLFQAPHQGFTYNVLADDSLLPRHNIPPVKPGTEQTIFIRDLPSEITQPGRHSVSIQTVSRTGRTSDPIIVSADLFAEEDPEAPVITLPAPAPNAAQGISVIPVIDKYDAAGRPIGTLPTDYRTHNALYDGSRIQLTAIAGEVVGFQILLRGQGTVSVKCDFDHPDFRTDQFRAVCVDDEGQSVPDPLLPISAEVALSEAADVSIIADVYIPFDTSPGQYHGECSVSDGRNLPIELTVLPFRMPRKASFLCEMNGYGLPDLVSEFYALQQVAYDHRVHANILHYSHRTAAPGARKSNLDMRLPSGRRMDNRRYDNIEPGSQTAYWDDFCEAFGSYLDGSYFRNGHRGAIAAPGFYLTFHESWPLNCRSWFNGNPDAYKAFSNSPVYSQTYISVLRDFCRTAKEQGWTDAGLQVYFNNKGSLNDPEKAPWILDEPASFWDYQALQYYGELTDRGTEESAGVTVDYRIDISRPEFCRGRLDGRSDLWVVSADAFRKYRRLITDRKELDGLKFRVYGTTNPVNESNRQILTWAIDAWQHGAEGIIPWQTIDKSGEALRKADQLGLFIFDRNPDGSTAIRHSMRLKAYREAEQLIEYLILVKDHCGLTPGQMRTFISHYTDLSGDVRKTGEEDAGTAVYRRDRLLGTDALRSAAVTMLRRAAQAAAQTR